MHSNQKKHYSLHGVCQAVGQIGSSLALNAISIPFTEEPTVDVLLSGIIFSTVAWLIAKQCGWHQSS